MPVPRVEDKRSRASRAELALGALVLALGTLVYALDRPPDSAPLLSAINLHRFFDDVFGSIGEFLPAFAHVFAFSLFTATWLGGGKRTTLLACVTWFGIDTAFEVGQHPQIAEPLVRMIPGWFEYLPILAQTDTYFLSGTFDDRDLISIAAGAATAYFVHTCIRAGEKRHE
ncbi:MAG TPA: hypothetical protein VIV14_03575 [Gammaproteobacteria bacterium]